MKAVYAIELNRNLVDEELVYLQNRNVQNTVDDAVLIIESIQVTEKIKEYLIDIGKYEESYKLIQLFQPVVTESFEDYGFILKDTFFLITEMVCGFTITRGEEEQIDMALIQMEEYILGYEYDERKKVFFVDIQQKELIERFALAYEIEVSFFDLDKWTEND